MTEPASCSGTTAEEMPVSLSEIAIGIDISASPCRVSVWNGSKEEIWKDMDARSVNMPSDTEITREENLSSLREIPIGIDIDTWPCCVAVWNGSYVEIYNSITKDKKIMKSYETFKDDVSSIRVISKTLLSKDQEHDMFYEATVYNMKRLIGSNVTDPAVNVSKNFPFMMKTLDRGIRPFFTELMMDKVWRYKTAEQFLGIYLGQLKELAKTQLKRPIRNVVFTVPVSFSRLQLIQIQRACEMAGLNVLKMIHQPIAVALLYAHQQLFDFTGEEMESEIKKNVLIFNMDSGYCDVAVTAITLVVCETKALTGSPIGGEDLLVNMMHHLLPDYENIFKKHIDGDKEMKSMSLLRVASKEAIHRLSSRTSVEFDLDLGDGLKIRKVVTRNEFEEVNKEVFEKCERLILQCLLDAKVEVEDIDDVIIVGGCSHIPKVKNIVTKICKRKELYKGMNPLEAALCGAAVAGVGASGFDEPSGNFDLLTFHITPLSIGIRANGNSFVPIIPRNTSVPTFKRISFTTIHDNQTEALILVYEGEGQMAEENHFLGHMRITGIPAAPKGVPEIIVCVDIGNEDSLSLKVKALVSMPDRGVVCFMEAIMPTPIIDTQHRWCVEKLNMIYGDTMDLVTLSKDK